MKIVEVSPVREAKDGRRYFVVGFRASFGQRPVKRTFWEQFKRDTKTGELTDQKYWERATPEEALALMKSGEHIDAKKVTRTVEPYFIGDNEVSSYSTVMFPDENEIALFNSQGHPIVDEETGEILKPGKRVVIAADAKEPVITTATVID